MKPIKLPWVGADVPHAMLDINRGCNILCRACYNTRGRGNKTLGQIELDINSLLKLRRLHTLTIAGGEPLLHPDLIAIVRAVKKRTLRAAIATNGLLLNKEKAVMLCDAGVDLVLLHIDPGQQRADLSDPENREEVRKLRKSKIRLVAETGMSAGLLVTTYFERPDDVADVVNLVLDLPCLQYVVFTGYVNFQQLKPVSGNLREGFCVEHVLTQQPSLPQMTNTTCRQLMEERFGAKPFAVLPSCGKTSYDAWLSYQAGVLYDSDKRVTHSFLESSIFERLGLRIRRSFTGRHAFFHDESALAQKIQLVLNSISGGTTLHNARLLLCAYPAGRFAMKHIVFQQGPTLDSEGALSICRDCPDAVVIDGSLVPVCLSDQFYQHGY